MTFIFRGVTRTYELEGKLVATTSRKLTIAQFIDLMRATNGYLHIDDGDAGERGHAGLQVLPACDLLECRAGGKVIWRAAKSA